MENTAQILEAHGIETRTENNSLLALEVSVLKGVVNTEWVNVTKFGRKQLMNWLGY